MTMFDLNLLWLTVELGILALGYRYYCYTKQKLHKEAKTKVKPSNYSPTTGIVAEVKQIFLYALEGGYPIEVEKATLCLGSGLEYRPEIGELPLTDRNFVVYTANNRLCYTTSIKLASVCLTRSNSLQLQTISDGKKLDIENEEINKDKYIPVNYMNQTLQVYDCGDRAALFLSQYLLDLPRGLRLGQFVVPLIRKNLNPLDENTTDPLLNQHYLIECMKPEFNNFSLISDKTIDYVKRLRGCEHVTPKHFRAHIVIELCNCENLGIWHRPFLEDEFDHVRIGSACFTNITLRSIDQSVNVDPQTGILSNNNEPFRALQSCRKAHYLHERLCDPISTPLLGINMEIKQTGIIRVGDQVWVQFKSNSSV